MAENIQPISSDTVIPFKPESMAKMRERLPAAFERVSEWFPGCAMASDNIDVRPEHIFDGADGTRAVIRRFKVDGKEMVYAMIAAAPGATIEDESREQFVVTASRFMHDLTGWLIHRSFEVAHGAIIITYDL